MSTKLIEIPIDEAVTADQPFTVDLKTTSKGGPIGGHFQQYPERIGVIAKNFREENYRLAVNGTTTTIPRFTTESITDQTPSLLHVEPAGSELTFQPSDLELLVIVAEKEREESSSLSSALAQDLNPLSTTLNALRGGR